MAAGLSILPENLLQFKEAFSEAISKHLNGKKPALDLLTDGELDASEMTLKNAQLLCKSAPWGQGFEEPIFYGDFEILDQKIVGEKHLKCTLKLIDDSAIFEGFPIHYGDIAIHSTRYTYSFIISTKRNTMMS